MDERIQQFRVGVMVLATIIILGILLLLFGDLPSVVKGTYTIRFAFPQAPGVTPDTPVRVNGILIGRVKRVDLDEKVGVMVTARIEQKYVLRKDQMARIGGSLLGDAVVEIVPTNLPNAPRDTLHDGDTMHGVVAKDPFQAITSLESNVSIALESIAKTSDEIGTLATHANKIVIGNEEQINRLIANTDLAVNQLRTTINNVDEVVNDPAVRQNLKVTVNDLPRVLTELSETITGVKATMQRADRNLANLEGITKPLGERGPRLVESLDRSIGQLDDVLGRVQQFTGALNGSQGTLARLMNDPGLYDQVSQTVENLNELTRELKPILRDARSFTDKAARHPEQFGVRGLMQPNSGIK